MIATALTIESQIGELLKEGLPGLCETCIHRQGCVYRLRSDKMVLQCELFEGEKTKHQATAPQMGEHKELNVSPHKGFVAIVSMHHIAGCQKQKVAYGTAKNIIERQRT